MLYFILYFRYIADLDSKTGSSLKLTVLNERGRIWTMVAGGGASVIYADTICDLGAGPDMANYGCAPAQNMSCSLSGDTNIPILCPIVSSSASILAILARL